MENVLKYWEAVQACTMSLWEENTVTVTTLRSKPDLGSQILECIRELEYPAKIDRKSVV